jgi:hypothetical protein
MLHNFSFNSVKRGTLRAADWHEFRRGYAGIVLKTGRVYFIARHKKPLRMYSFVFPETCRYQTHTTCGPASPCPV